MWDREGNDWVRLNVGEQEVDYRITDVEAYDASIVWEPRYDYTEIIVFLNDSSGETIETLRFLPNIKKATIRHLSPGTAYEVNVIAERSWGPTLSHRQSFSTRAAIVPAAPVSLGFLKRTNKSIDLVWKPSSYGDVAEYVVYSAVGNRRLRRVGIARSPWFRVRNLKPDTKYRFAVRGVSPDGVAGPMSNILKSATGHNEVRRKGRTRRLVLPPHRWGSWRSDIHWNWWFPWPKRVDNKSIYQGYWRYRSKRYWGIIEYDSDELRAIIDKRFGAGVGDHFNVTSAALRRVYRQRRAGNNTPQVMVWHLTSTKVRRGRTQPTTFLRHVNDRNSPDSLRSQMAIRAGTGINMLRIPRSWGQNIIQGHRNNKKVTGLALFRNDNDNNGYGYAGYMKISGHNQPDYHLGGGGGRKSDLSLVVAGSWNFVVRPYKAPYSW